MQLQTAHHLWTFLHLFGDFWHLTHSYRVAYRLLLVLTVDSFHSALHLYIALRWVRVVYIRLTCLLFKCVVFLHWCRIFHFRIIKTLKRVSFALAYLIFHKHTQYKCLPTLTLLFRSVTYLQWVFGADGKHVILEVAELTAPRSSLADPANQTGLVSVANGSFTAAWAQQLPLHEQHKTLHFNSMFARQSLFDSLIPQTFWDN